MRYLPLTGDDRRDMLAVIGAASVDELFRDIPASARIDGLLDLPNHQGELEVERAMTAMAARNRPAGAGPSFLGGGAYRHHIPAAVDHLIQRSEFLTSYTPYQPEISQGTLQFLFEFQTQVAMLTGMEVANASMYEGATATAEAVLMAQRLTRRHGAVLSGSLHPHYRETVRTQTQFLGLHLDLAPTDISGGEDLASRITADTACVVVQTPDFFGNLHDTTDLAKECHEAGALLVVVVTEPVSFGALKAPGDMGADIVAGEGQSLGVGLNFGGPYVGLFATRSNFVRQMPGRLCGETVDADGRRAWVLTLSTREQHIRRQKATSNICTNSGLCALSFGIHVALLGEAGLRRLAALNHAAAVRLADRLDAVPGVRVVNRTFFNEFTVELAAPAAAAVDTLAADGILAGVPVSRLVPDDPALANLLLVAATETNTDAEMDALATGLTRVTA
ncbi:MAG: aminomethyl-transferring glycine dehydrogenase subunit GcvPA [Proteobacteria bacterium]|nr:aminomethyl-transferring glycine dehydrogenase subunit GcvPA [Pseudomonadota bacterium]